MSKTSVRDTHGFEGINPALLAAWRDAVVPTNRHPGAGWFSASDLETIWGVSRETANRRLQVLRREGKVKITNGSMLGIDGKRHYTLFYRLVEGTR